MRGGIQLAGVASGDAPPTGGCTDRAGLPLQLTLVSFPGAFEPLQSQLTQGERDEWDLQKVNMELQKSPQLWVVGQRKRVSRKKPEKGQLDRQGNPGGITVREGKAGEHLRGGVVSGLTLGSLQG